MHVEMSGKKLLDPLCFVGGQVVGDDVNLLPFGLARNYLTKESNKLFTGVPVSCLPNHLSRLSVECPIERKRPMSVVLKPMSLSPSGRQRKYRIQAVQRLNSCLLIYAKHGCVLRRVHVQPDDVGCFGFKVRVIGDHVALNPVWLQLSSPPHASDHHMTHPELLAQPTGTPVGRTITRTFERMCQNSSFQFRCQSRNFSTFMPRIQISQATFEKTFLPAADVRRVAGQRLLNVLVRLSLFEHQNQFGPSHIASAMRSRPRASSECIAFSWGELDVVLHDRIIQYSR